jgi:hypothetical protein
MPPAPIAQLVELRTFNPQVPGSSPGGGTRNRSTEKLQVFESPAAGQPVISIRLCSRGARGSLPWSCRGVGLAAVSRAYDSPLLLFVGDRGGYPASFIYVLD